MSHSNLLNVPYPLLRWMECVEEERKGTGDEEESTQSTEEGEGEGEWWDGSDWMNKEDPMEWKKYVHRDENEISYGVDD